MAKETGHAPGRAFIDQNGVYIGNQSDIQLITGDGAITLWSGTVFLAKGSAAAITLAAPVVGDDDGRTLIIISETAFAHVVTAPSNVINGNKVTATFGATANNNIEFVARNGFWRTVGTSLGITLA